jgi:SAM-dependent methyltransferase
MRPRRDGIEATNLEFYEQAYTVRHLPGLLFKQLLSYDQLSKARRNLRLLRRLPEFSRGLSVLDYGFGHGTLLLRLPRVHRLYGCELSPQAMRNLELLCRFLHREVNLHLPHELAAAQGSLSLDLVCCSHVIEHVDDDAALLQMFHGILNPEGRLLLNIPINEVWDDPKHIRSYSKESIGPLLRSAGFTVQEVLEADRWTAWILHLERVSSVRFKSLFRPIRLLLALLPVAAWDALEKFLPEKYKFQQLLVLAKKT